jgi:hypothetical protein
MTIARVALLLFALVAPSRAWAQSAEHRTSKLDQLQIGGLIGAGATLSGGRGALLQEMRVRVHVPVGLGLGLGASGVYLGTISGALDPKDAFFLIGGGLDGSYELRLAERDALRFEGGLDLGWGVAEGTTLSPTAAVSWIQEVKLGPDSYYILGLGVRGSVGLGIRDRSPGLVRAVLSFAL